MQVKKKQLELDMEQWFGSKLGKKYVKAVYCHSAYLTSMQITSCKMLGWMTQAGIKIGRWNIENLKYADDTTLMAESEEELESLLRVKEKSEKSSLKLSIQKTKIMASGLITSWQMEGEKSANNDRLYFLELPNHCKIKTLAPWKESYFKPRQCIKKQRDDFAKKGPYSQSYGFSSSHAWMWELHQKEGWVLKRIDAFVLRC